MTPTICDWQPPHTLPTETPGSYIVRLGGEHVRKSGCTLQVYNVVECASGFMLIVGGSMASDYLDDECYVVAWAPEPEGPEWGTKA